MAHHEILRRLKGGVCACAFALCAGPVYAGPPYVTDDPEPTDTGHWENYLFVSGVDTRGVTTGQAGFDLNYGAYKDLQLTAVIPLDYDTLKGGAAGAGDIQLGGKYRFLHQDEQSWTPDVALFPTLLVPAADRRFGSGRTGLFLPVWAEKDTGKWSVFGGGGYTFNPGPGLRGFWLTGVAVQRQFNDKLSIGVEVYHQTPDTAQAKPFTGINLGVIYKMIDHWSVIGAAGPGVQNANSGGGFDFYLALNADY